MTNYNSKAVKFSPDKDNSFENSSRSMQIFTKTARKNTQISSMQKQKSIANLITILCLIDNEREEEQDEKILAILNSQKEVLQKVLTQKQTGKKSSFESAENKAISQLQNQILNLEKSVKEKLIIILQSVDEKFTTTLKSFESSQAAVKIYAQIASQNSFTRNQKQEQETSQKTQKSKFYTKSETKQVKQVQKKNQNSYEARRLILHVKVKI